MPYHVVTISCESPMCQLVVRCNETVPRFVECDSERCLARVVIPNHNESRDICADHTALIHGTY